MSAHLHHFSLSFCLSLSSPLSLPKSLSSPLLSLSVSLTLSPHLPSIVREINTKDAELAQSLGFNTLPIAQKVGRVHR